MSDTPACARSSCDSIASFRFYDPTSGIWTPICERHALTIHPSLELRVLLESGYLRPVEIEPPPGPPTRPPTNRGRAFREAVEELLGWST